VNILVLGNLYPPHYLGGYEILCAQVVDLLRARGHGIEVLTSVHRNEGVPYAPVRDGIHRLLRLYAPFSRPAGIERWARLTTALYNYRRTRVFLASRRPDLVFVWSQLRLTVGAARAVQEAGLPMVYTFNDEHIAGFSPASCRPAPRSLAAWLADATVCRPATLRGLRFPYSTCISRLLKDNLVRAGVPIEDSRVIYQGIPIERFPRREHPPAVPTREPRLLYAGQLHAYKGVHTLVAAAHRLAADPAFAAVTVDIAGDGPEDYKARLQREAAAGPARISFLGRRPHQELSGLYRDHDVFVFPSVWQEPFGLTHLEAMASGTPVVSTADGGHGEFLVHEENALVFGKEDEQALAAQLRRLLTDPVLAHGLADRARRLVETRFSLGRYVEDLERLLLDAREGRPA